MILSIAGFPAHNLSTDPKDSTLMKKDAPGHKLAERVYEQIKRDIFEFRLLPGDRFTESEVATRMGVSRTPVRQALFKLEKEGHIQVSSRNGWHVPQLDFEFLENLYDVRVILELAAVKRLCEVEPMPDLSALKQVWLVPADQRVSDMHKIAELDERFHEDLVAAAGNPEIARIHHDVTERIRIIRRLDFTQPERIATTYQEHGQILRQILRRKWSSCELLLRSHIESSKAEVRKITIHKLHASRSAALTR